MGKNVFISFDFDHDFVQKQLLVGQSKNPRSPFTIKDSSIKQEIKSDWKEKARIRIKNCDGVIVMCGHYTNTAQGVATELQIAKEEGIPYFLLSAYNDHKSKKPTTANENDKVFVWSWDNLQRLIKKF